MRVPGSQTSSAPVAPHPGDNLQVAPVEAMAAPVEAKTSAPPPTSYIMPRQASPRGSFGSVTMPVANFVQVRSQRYAQAPRAQTPASSFHQQVSGTSFASQVSGGFQPQTSGGYAGGTLRMASSSAPITAYAVGPSRMVAPATPKTLTRMARAPSKERAATMARTASKERVTGPSRSPSRKRVAPAKFMSSPATTSSLATTVGESLYSPRETPPYSPTNLLSPVPTGTTSLLEPAASFTDATTSSPDAGSADTAFQTCDTDTRAIDTDVSVNDGPLAMSKFEAYLPGPDPVKIDVFADGVAPYDVAPVVVKEVEENSTRALVTDNTSNAEVIKERAAWMDVQGQHLPQNVFFIDQDVLVRGVSPEASEATEPKPSGRFRALKCFGA